MGIEGARRQVGAHVVLAALFELLREFLKGGRCHAFSRRCMMCLAFCLSVRGFRGLSIHQALASGAAHQFLGARHIIHAQR